MKYFPGRLLMPCLLMLATLTLAAQEKKALGLEDMMKFRQLESPAISKDGRWLVHTARPDRGDPEVLVYSTDGKKKYSILLGENPYISNDGNWVVATEAVSPEVLFKSDKGKDKENGPKPGMVLLNTATGEQEIVDNIASFRFSEDSRFLLYHRVQRDAKKKTGTELVVRTLGDTLERTFSFVQEYALDSISNNLVYTVSDTLKTNNGIYLAQLEQEREEVLPLLTDSLAWASGLEWNRKTGQLVFLAGLKDDKDKKKEACLLGWSPGQEAADTLLEDRDLETGWRIYHTQNMQWSKDGKRLFLGLKPNREYPEEEEEDSIKDFYGEKDILAGRGVDVWHWNDPYISPNQKIMWKREKDRSYKAVYYPVEDRLIPLATVEIPDLHPGQNSHRLVLSTNLPYAREATWDGRYRDFYLCDLQSGERRKILEHQEHSVSLSPDGRFLSWYRDGDWHLMDATTLESRNLTKGLPVDFSDEDWDYPADVPGYGLAGWVDQSTSVLVYDKFDIWEFPTAGGEARCLTEGKGREGLYQFRIRNLDPEQPFLENGSNIFLTAYHDSLKHTALYRMKMGTPGVKSVVEEEKKFSLVAKAKDADMIIYSRESYTEFPDLWACNSKFKKPLKLTDVNPQVKDFTWGNARLVEWKSMDGKPLQGILITPDDYVEGQRLPVLVYYYRFFTDRLYEFNHVAINHRPCFPYYAGNGYAVFLPDIRFDVGTPGYAATKCLVPGVQHLIDMGVADPNAICLHGHSWSGYQTAQVITQTDMFTCAIAGAPVSNMTSAYSGIRWGSGLARQFQYEKSQSRIGGSLWEARDKYIENSPVFFADRIHTPLLIMFGDEDGAVPWYQGIELYLAMRRLDKDCIFLQYRGEDHHPKKYANKLDYTIKFKNYLDHYLKGEPAAEWIEKGSPYNGS